MGGIGALRVLNGSPETDWAEDWAEKKSAPREGHFLYGGRVELLFLGEGEVIDVDIAAWGFGGVVEDGELGAHEEGADIELHLYFAAERDKFFAVEAVGESGYVAAVGEVTFDLEVDGFTFDFDWGGGEGVLVDMIEAVVTLELEVFFCHSEGGCLACLGDAKDAAGAAEGCEAAFIAVLHLADVELNGACAFRAFHPLGYGVWGYVDIVDYAGGLHAEVARAFAQAPCTVDRVVVPLPVEGEILTAEVVAAENTGLVYIFCLEIIGYFAVLVAKDRPSVFPMAWHVAWYAANSASILEEDAVPLSCR